MHYECDISETKNLKYLGERHVYVVILCILTLSCHSIDDNDTLHNWLHFPIFAYGGKNT